MNMTQVGWDDVCSRLGTWTARQHWEVYGLGIEGDERPLVKYKPMHFQNTQVGYMAIVMTENGNVECTDEVTLYVPKTGYFETAHTRYTPTTLH